MNFIYLYRGVGSCVVSPAAPGDEEHFRAMRNKHIALYDELVSSHDLIAKQSHYHTDYWIEIVERKE